MRDRFIFRCDIIERFNDLSNEDLGVLTRAMCSYVKDGELIKLPNKLKTIFDFVKFDIDSDTKKYELKCEKNRQSIMSRWNKNNKNNKNNK